MVSDFGRQFIIEGWDKIMLLCDSVVSMASCTASALNDVLTV